MLRQHRPTADLVKQLLSRDSRVAGDDFVESALLCWCRGGRAEEERLGELVGALLTQRCCHTSPNKRKRGAGGGGASTAAASREQPTCERILSHLDRLSTHFNV
ncbi:hypothetical protein LSTR_LSTR006277 [Laodelphax striatellus]|uniref:Ints3-like C-terminal domain-containing protein n=1 Tax=Laodelphax striatellus TaxID=195883 RepID=A0A482WQC8_LAOST|nr:hypothetical protein LSTR_LSTR006277 [Laodelphax striatellus]